MRGEQAPLAARPSKTADSLACIAAPVFGKEKQHLAGHCWPEADTYLPSGLSRAISPIFMLHWCLPPMRQHAGISSESEAWTKGAQIILIHNNTINVAVLRTRA
ncbi:MAG TPA: hypothetical protein VG892_05015 [Terriglobales bacterium]|nr:hypothetical protein [Terriglobales bacterium]